MAPTFDVAIAGLGAMGAAAARALAGRGLRVVGFDRFAPPHGLGSSHGRSRIIREAYFEHPDYVPLVQHALRLWQALERESGERLLIPTGGLRIGAPEGALVRGALASAEAHGLAHERLDAAGIARRAPAMHPGDGMVGVWEPNAGVLLPEIAIAALLASARAHGATLRPDEPVISWREAGSGVEVRTARGTVSAGRLVLACGAWLPELLQDLALPLVVERMALFWFEPRHDPAAFDPGRFPIFILEHARDRYIYGFPRLDGLVKLARHHEGETTHPDRVRREVSFDEEESLRETFRPFLPGADGVLRDRAVCLYTNTPDEHFVVGPHPRHPGVTVVSACSGHGFKFAPSIGEIVADLVTAGATRWDLERFSPARFVDARG